MPWLVLQVTEVAGNVPSRKSNSKTDSAKKKRGRPKKSREGLEAEKPKKKSKRSLDAAEVRELLEILSRFSVKTFE